MVANEPIATSPVSAEPAFSGAGIGRHLRFANFQPGSASRHPERGHRQFGLGIRNFNSESPTFPRRDQSGYALTGAYGV